MYYFSDDCGGGEGQSGISGALMDVNHTIDELAAKLSFLKENISSYWNGPAATNYVQLLSDIKVESIQALIKELETELVLAQAQLAAQQATIETG